MDLGGNPLCEVKQQCLWSSNIYLLHGKRILINPAKNLLFINFYGSNNAEDLGDINYRQ